jgi:hypothetical protein
MTIVVPLQSVDGLLATDIGADDGRVDLRGSALRCHVLGRVWIHVGESQLEPWHVLSENAILRDRLIAHAVSIPVLYDYGVPVDQLDLPMSDARWMQLRHHLKSVTLQPRLTLQQRVAHWQSVRPYSGPVFPTVRQRIESIPRRRGSREYVVEVPGDLNRRMSEAEWY